MRILSNFKDYYDFVAGHDEDPRKVYNRNLKIVGRYTRLTDHPIFDTIDEYTWYLGGEGKSVDFFIGSIWFCDQFYQYVKSGDKFYYNYYHIPEMTRKAINKRLIINSTWRRAVSLETIFRIEKLSMREKQRNELLEKPMNTLYGQPILYSRLRDHAIEVVINGNLKEIEFSQVKKPTMAFTELYNWLPYHEPSMPNDPTDMGRYEGKGFDKKISFRHPTK